MKVLVTAGSTNVMIDKVRCISNIFKGKTGADIAVEFGKAGCDVTLLTSAPSSLSACSPYYLKSNSVIQYKTYDELYDLMKHHICNHAYDVVIHSAAVSDYKVEGTYKYFPGGFFAPGLSKIDSSKKISSSESELFLKLVKTEKIIDKIRDPWGFKGKLVKFKLQVGISDNDLLDIATKSCADSNADFIVANCLEWARERAYIANSDGFICSVNRDNLPSTLLSYLIGE